jgi:membrane protein DedA with SNARE-associated domain
MFLAFVVGMLIGVSLGYYGAMWEMRKRVASRRAEIEKIEKMLEEVLGPNWKERRIWPR